MGLKRIKDTDTIKQNQLQLKEKEKKTSKHCDKKYKLPSLKGKKASK